MKMIHTIFKKELKDTLRDRRTIITMLVVPVLLFPILIGISSSVISSKIKEARERVLDVGMMARGNAVDFQQFLEGRDDVNLVLIDDIENGKELIQSDSLHAFFLFHDNFDNYIREMKSGLINFYFKGTDENEIEKRRALRLLEDYEEKLQEKRFAKLKLDVQIINTIDVQEMDLASAKERIADYIGGLLPYFFIIFCFMGSMYPAIDLAAGEKERGTLETLLTSPVSRMQILLGKFGVVVLTGIVSACFSFLGLYIGIRRAHDIPPELLKTLLGILEPGSIILLISLLLPLTIFFAALMLSLSIFARSFKEAQSYISPLMIVVIIPAFLGLLPGMDLNSVTAWIPIFNVTLATKAIIAGHMETLLLIKVYLSCIVLAAISLLICSKIFSRENVIFRST